MHDISKIDKNFVIKTAIKKSDIRFYSALSSPFTIHGIFHEGGRFRRMPEAIARTVSDGVYSLHANTAGGRIRFKTNSPYVAISAKMPSIGKMSHFALCGSAGFDLYVDGIHVGSYLPPFDVKDGYEGIIELGNSEMKDVLINFPLYSDVSDLFLGLAENAEILAPKPYKINTPLVFYGSSITQGGCASRPGTSYQGFISRDLDADYINLGFSGSAYGEKEIADYIKSLNMSAFICDYDFNAPTVHHLEKTHEQLFLAVREAHPTLPIILISNPKLVNNKENSARLDIIKRTHSHAIERGDENVYMIDGSTLLSSVGGEGTVDTTHPTDLGFFAMARVIGGMLSDILGAKNG